MDRRELLKMIALATGSVVIGGEFFLSGCKNPATKPVSLLTADDITFLDEVAETILPKTKTPGAKDAETGLFMSRMVNDCYEVKDQNVFMDGIRKLDEACKKAHGHGFISATVEQRTDLLKILDAEAKKYNKEKKDDEPNHYFTMMKQLALLGYFTSKPALTESFDYVPTPGKYDGAYPYQKGDKLFV